MKNQRFTTLLNLLEQSGNQALSHQFLVGLERETIRVNREGHISQSDHPVTLGSTLTHPAVTTDFAEAQIELVTPKPLPTFSQLIEQMVAIHSIVSQRLPEEYLWPLSMPMEIENEESIQIARFGTSNTGHFKEVYRQGLVHRYGKKMQIISGLHFNYSFSDDFWKCLHQELNPQSNMQEFITSNYFHLSRNYLRSCWLITYLYGFTPVIDKSALKQCPEDLKAWDEQTYYGPYATSLRMSNLGYANTTRCQSYVSYNGQQPFLDDLLRTLTTACEDFTDLGVKDDSGYRQLNDSILQIENELYSFIRPKQPQEENERPYNAVKNRGISYIEIRGIDINPYEPVGISIEQLEFLRLFAIYCLLSESEPFTRKEERINTHNQSQVAIRGRDPELKLQRGTEMVSLKSWAEDIFIDLRQVAQLLDRGREPYYTSLVETQYQKVLDVNQTPSAILLDKLKKAQVSHQEFGLNLAHKYKNFFKEQSLSEDFVNRFDESVEQSLEKMKKIEENSTETFEEYLKSQEEKLY